MPKLTKKIVDDAAPAASAYFIWCSELSGFGVRVHPTGKRVYYADYRNALGRRKRMSLGSHGKITAEDARKLALVTLGAVVKGEDPAEERMTRRTSLTVSELCDNYLKAAERGLILGKGKRPKKLSTLYSDRGRIERHIKPLLGTRLVYDLLQADINKFVRDVTAGKTAVAVKTGKKRGKAVVQGGAGTASRTAGLLGGIMSFAVSEGVRTDNPVRGVQRQADGMRNRRLDRSEFAALGKALSECEADGLELPQAIAGVRLLALTGCRLGEIAKLSTAEVDRVSGCFRLRDTKEGASVRPVGQAAFDVINAVSGPKYVLPGERREDAPFGGLPGAVRRIMKKAGLEGVTAYTLRHSFASVAGDLGYSDSTIGALLGHAGNSVTSRYVHRLDAVLVAAANKVAGEVWRQMTDDVAKMMAPRLSLSLRR